MTEMTGDRDGFRALPEPRTTDGKERRTGVEVEFSGLSEAQVADILQARFGGEISRCDAHRLRVEDSEVGVLKVELDTALAKKDTGKAGSRAMDLLRGLVPVEVITEPLTVEQIARFDSVIADLREAGASGSRDGVFLGFGVHLNPEVVSADAPHTLRTVRAFALMDPVLRKWNNIDVTRRVLPFVKPWPKAFVGLLVEEKPESLADLIDLCDPHVRTRNHALDLLPLFKWAVPKLFEASYPDDTATSARPTFHFRLPDSRINEPGWSLREPWEMWRQVEAVAACDRLEALEEAWRAQDEAGALARRDGAWVKAASDILQDAEG